MNIPIPPGVSPEQVRDALRDLPGVLSGRLPDRGGVAASLLSAVGLKLLGLVSENYERQSEGGPGVFGTWEPLALATLLARRVVATKASSGRIRREWDRLDRRGKSRVAEQARRLVTALTTPEGREVRQNALRILRAQLRVGTITQRRFDEARRRLRGKLDPERAKLTALAMAQAKILRDTGRTLQSLTPHSSSPEQVLRTGRGEVTVGSNVETLKYHQSSAPRKLKADGTPRLPRRQVLPDPGEMPPAWRQAVREVILDAVRSPVFWQQYLGG